FSAKRDVQVEAKWRRGPRRRIQDSVRGRHVFRPPKRKWWVVRNEVTTNLRFVFDYRHRRKDPRKLRTCYSPKQKTFPSSFAITMRPAATAGEEVTLPPVVNFQTSLPVSKFSPYTLPSCDPTNTRLPTMAGDESTRPLVGNDQRSSPVAGSSA